jgi:hypothetical protein
MLQCNAMQYVGFRVPGLGYGLTSVTAAATTNNPLQLFRLFCKVGNSTNKSDGLSTRRSLSRKSTYLQSGFWQISRLKDQIVTPISPGEDI